MKKNIVLSAILVVIILVVVYSWVSYLEKQSPTKEVNKPASNQPVETATKPEPFTQIRKDQPPQNFPTEVLLEKDAAIISNFTTTNPQENIVAGREYVSKMTMDKNLSAFKNALPGLGWTLINKIIDQTDQKIIEASKKNQYLRVRIYKNGAQVMVFVQVITKK